MTQEYNIKMKQQFIDQLDHLISTYQTQTAIDMFSSQDPDIPSETLVKVGPLLYELQQLLEEA